MKLQSEIIHDPKYVYDYRLEVVSHINYIFYDFDPDIPFELYSTCTEVYIYEDIDSLFVSLSEGRFVVTGINRAGRYYEISIADALELWRTKYEYSMDSSKFHRVRQHILKYICYEEARKSGKIDSVSLAFSEGGEIESYQINLAIKAETVEGEEREEILERLRRAEGFRAYCYDPAKEALDVSILKYQRESLVQEIQKHIRLRARQGADIDVEERARLTVKISQLEVSAKELERDIQRKLKEEA